MSEFCIPWDLHQEGSAITVATPSDTPRDWYFLDNSNLKTQDYVEEINNWTNDKKWRPRPWLLTSPANWFGTRMKLENTNKELMEEMKIFGTVIFSYLNLNTKIKHIIKKVNKNMIFLKKIQSFGATLMKKWFFFRHYIVVQYSSNSMLFGHVHCH